MRSRFERYIPIFEAIRQTGGRALVVGGTVRDLFLGLDSKDLDIEVFGLDPERTMEVLRPFGAVSLQGMSFPVYRLEFEGENIEVSFPRRERKVAPGYTGFEVDIDPTMTPKEAAERRDFTINAMMYDPLEDKILDFFGGRGDLASMFNGGKPVLRAVSQRFREDPLRVLRGMQFAARFDAQIMFDGMTPGMMVDLKDEYSALSRERIWGEWEKWALRGTVPSRGLWLLQQIGWLSLYPELEYMREVRQDRRWHPEGDVWEHTKQAVDRASEIADHESLSREDRMVLVFAALLHDSGKPMTTVINPIEQKITSHGHAEAGEIVADSFLRKIGAPHWLSDKVLPLIRNHMDHVDLPRQRRAVNRLAHRIFPNTVQMYVWLVEADASARRAFWQGEALTDNVSPAKDLLEVGFDELPVDGTGKPTKLVKGRDLLPFMEPGQQMGWVIDLAYRAQQRGEFTTTEEGVAWARQFISCPPAPRS